jgi:hypothetical protein
MKNLIISPTIQDKLTNKHQVTRKEVEQCFTNRTGGIFLDDREDHKTDPATLWFVAPTHQGRLLKVIFVFDPKSRKFYLKSAYDTNQKINDLYEKLESN